MTWKIDLEPGQSVAIGDFGTITLEKKSGQSARLSFQVDKSIALRRVEQHQATSAPQSGISESVLGTKIPQMVA